jgi:hypothetical protein
MKQMETAVFVFTFGHFHLFACPNYKTFALYFAIITFFVLISHFKAAFSRQVAVFCFNETLTIDNEHKSYLLFVTVFSFVTYLRTEKGFRSNEEDYVFKSPPAPVPVCHRSPYRVYITLLLRLFLCFVLRI